MLEKMGWTKGKGLGINEQGIKEFSNTSYKNDTTGVGYDKSFEAWTEHQHKFGSFLQQLNGNQDQDAIEESVDTNANFNEQSIELKSKQSHARVHYKKFTRGKDVNRYKSKDLANIFGQKELIEKTQVMIEKNNIREKEADNRDNWYGVNTINSGNMVDYFKLKLNSNDMTNYLKYNVKPKNDTNLSSIIDNPTINSENENDQHIGFEFTPKIENTSVSSYRALRNSDDKSNYAFDNPCLGFNSSVETACNINDSSVNSIKKRKKDFESDNSHITETDKNNARKKFKTETIDSDYKNGFTNPALNLDTKSEDCNGKEFEVFRAQLGLENCGLDLTDERNNKKRVTFNDHVMLYKYNINSIKKKKKGEATLDKFEVENKKNKKNRKHESTATSTMNGIVNEALDVLILTEEINDNELNEHKNKKIKKRKISKTSNLETIQESPEKEIEIIIESENTLDSNIIENGETDNVEKSKKKKKKDKKEKRVKVEDITVLRTINEEPDIEIIEVTSNKKILKTKDSKEEETVLSKKCKKKKKKDKENCKNEKHIQTEINNDQQDIKILDKSNSQQNDYLIESENKTAVIIKTLQCTVPVTEEEKSLEKTKQKKKKRKHINKEEYSSEINVHNIEREISDKENADKEQTLNTKKLAKKNKKGKKLKNKNVSDVEDSSNLNEEVVDLNVTKQDKIENMESTDTPSKKGNVIDIIDNIINSPWSVKARMPKKMLVTLFQNNAILEFPGSNIHNIKGYGIDVESEQ
ncbi:PREDICTED: suppressor of Mek1-like isoform X2 [Atta colombica]|nr:PREDICTED: suppressor of Mek1-like isoform X2 [Atta colombica]